MTDPWRRSLGPLLILSCTVIWGTAFLAQKSSAAIFAPITITCLRNLLGGVFLAAVVGVRTGRRGWAAARPSRTELVGGALSGLCLFAAMLTQQLGIESTTAGTSAFLTANYILIVPLIAWALGRGRPAATIWVGVALALVGTGLICLGGENAAGGFTLGRGEAWTLLCALLFAVQIMVVDRYASRAGTDVLKFSAVQLLASALIAAPLILALPAERAGLGWDPLRSGWFELCYLGIASSGIAYTLQNLGQALTPPGPAAVIMSFESVVGAIGGFLAFGETPTAAGICGCVLVFVAVLLGGLSSR